MNLQKPIVQSCFTTLKVFISLIKHTIKVNPFPNKPWFFTCLLFKSFENAAEKGVIACNKQFLLFPVFSTLLENFLQFSSTLKLSSAKSFSLKRSKICCLGKGYIQEQPLKTKRNGVTFHPCAVWISSLDFL